MLKALAVGFAAAALAVAQPLSGTFSGTVSDPSGARVPPAVITVADANGHHASAYSDDEGAFTFTGLPAGQYLLEVRHAGFAMYHQENVNVTGSGDVRLDVPLQVGGVNEVLEVVARRPGPPPA